MALPTYHCLECEKTFKAGDWACGATGQNHVLAPKRYYMDDAPTVTEWRDGRPFINKAASRTQVLNIPPERKEQNGDEFIRIPGGSVEFVRGMFETTNPELQFYLDRKAGLCTYERWKEVYWTDDEKINEQKMEIQAAQNRLQSERNELLEKVRAMENQGSPAEAPKRRGRPPKILVENPANAAVS